MHAHRVYMRLFARARSSSRCVASRGRGPSLSGDLGGPSAPPAPAAVRRMPAGCVTLETSSPDGATNLRRQLFSTFSTFPHLFPDFHAFFHIFPHFPHIFPQFPHVSIHFPICFRIFHLFSTFSHEKVDSVGSLLRLDLKSSDCGAADLPIRSQSVTYALYCNFG